jgi:hypothetical protein
LFLIKTYPAKPKFIRMIFIGAGTLAGNASRNQCMRIPIQFV